MKMFCNNNKCEMHKTCFRFLPKHSLSSDLLSKKKDKCLNYIEWTYPEEINKKLEKVKDKANEFYDKHTKHINKLVLSAEMGYPPSDEDFNNPMLWKPEHWFWFLKSR